MSEAIAEAEVLTTPLGDTEPPVTGDAAPETQETPESAPDYTADLEAYLAESEGKEPSQPQPEPELEQVDFDALSRMAGEFNTDYANWMKHFDSLEQELISEGLSPAAAKNFVKEAKGGLNSHHAKALSHGHAVAWTEGQLWEKQDIAQGVVKALPAATKKALDTRLQEIAKKTPGKPVGYDAVFKTLWEMATAEGEAKGVKKGFIDGRGFESRQKAQSTSGTTANGTTRVAVTAATEDAQLLNPEVPQKVKDAILVKRGML